MISIHTAGLIDKIDSLSKKNNSKRLIVGIVGPPGAGKSTLSGQLEEQLNARGHIKAKVVPMDGFHLSNQELSSINLLDLKGVPDSFDSHSFVELVKRISKSLDKSVKFPLFDRAIESTIADADQVEPEHNLILLEGNYLLLEKSPWHHIRNYLDLSIYIEESEEVLFERLVERHIEGGKSREEAIHKVRSTDFPNAKLVAQTASSANILLAPNR